LGEDELVGWAWNPGRGRQPAPGMQKSFGELIKAWVDSGGACPERPDEACGKKPDLGPHLEGPDGPLFGSGSLLALRGLQRQIQRRGYPYRDPVRRRHGDRPVRKLDSRWSTCASAIALFGGGARRRSGWLLGLQASRVMTTVTRRGLREHRTDQGQVPRDRWRIFRGGDQTPHLSKTQREQKIGVHHLSVRVRSAIIEVGGLSHVGS
jgi:hypothetical protein